MEHGEGYFKRSPLHMAASCGDTKRVQELLRLDSELAEVLDSRLWSALHLASAKGHVQIVKDLIEANREMCLARDRDGRNPLHIAAMKGEVKVLEELVQASPNAARVMVDQNETILHLCVKHNQIESLMLLLEKMGQEFVNAKDGSGNTILHLAVSAKQLQVVQYLLEKSKIDVNATNANGHTVMDILFLSQNGTVPDVLHLNIEDFLREAKAKRARDLIQGEWLTKKRDALMVVASLIATMAFQVGVNPPGGVWQDDKDGHRAGEATMAYHYSDSYPYFLRFNTTGFVMSLSTILLLISGLPFRKRVFMWVLLVSMWMTITSTAVTYAYAIIVVTPKKDRKSLSRTVKVAVIVWCSVMALLLIVQTVRLIARLFEEKRSRDKAIEKIFRLRGGRGRRCKGIEKILELCRGRPNGGKSSATSNSGSHTNV